MPTPVNAHRGLSGHSFHLLILGNGFVSESDLVDYADLTIAELWAIHPFGLAKEKLNIWVLAADSGYFSLDSMGRVTGIDIPALSAGLDGINAAVPEFPPWKFWSDTRAMRRGVIIVDAVHPGYSELLTGPQDASPVEILCSVLRHPEPPQSILNALVSQLLFNRWVVLAAFPFGGNQIVSTGEVNRYAAIATQWAKAIGLSVGLGDEYEGGSPVDYSSGDSLLPANLDDSDIGNVPDNWKWSGYRRGASVTSLISATTQLSESELRSIFLVPSDSELSNAIGHSPMSDPPAFLEAIDGAHRVEGGMGHRRGIYRSAIQCIMRFPWLYLAGPPPVFTPQRYCSVCSSHMQNLLLGNATYRLGQKSWDPVE